MLDRQYKWLIDLGTVNGPAIWRPSRNAIVPAWLARVHMKQPPAHRVARVFQCGPRTHAQRFCTNGWMGYCPADWDDGNLFQRHRLPGRGVYCRASPKNRVKASRRSEVMQIDATILFFPDLNRAKRNVTRLRRSAHFVTGKLTRQSQTVLRAAKSRSITADEIAVATMRETGTS
jgi:hypothetical protein